MFVPSIIHHRSCKGTSCKAFVADTFGILCWNVYKNNLKNPAFKPFMKKLAAKKQIDFLLFQEANFRNNLKCGLQEFAFEAAANIEYRGEFYGVLTASRVNAQKSQAYLSKGKESLFGPYKSLLLDYYPFRDGTQLLVLNIHAINFRENQRYNIELERLNELVKNHSGPMIIAGDFNSWNTKRTEKLHKARKALSLDTVTFKEGSKVKSFMGNHLDFIFYRGMKLLDSAVLDNHGLSDHNPLFAKFRKI